MDCINLKERFGRLYRVTYEESYRADRGDGARAADPWLLMIPCRRGHIFPHGGDMLAASTDKAGEIARRLKALPGAIVHQDGTDGATILFPVGLFDEVAAIMLPRRRRHLSPEARRKAGERLAKYQFRPVVEPRGEPLFCVGTG